MPVEVAGIGAGREDSHGDPARVPGPSGGPLGSLLSDVGEGPIDGLAPDRAGDQSEDPEARHVRGLVGGEEGAVGLLAGGHVSGAAPGRLPCRRGRRGALCLEDGQEHPVQDDEGGPTQ